MEWWKKKKKLNKLIKNTTAPLFFLPFPYLIVLLHLTASSDGGVDSKHHRSITRRSVDHLLLPKTTPEKKFDSALVSHLAKCYTSPKQISSAKKISKKSLRPLQGTHPEGTDLGFPTEGTRGWISDSMLSHIFHIPRNLRPQWEHVPLQSSFRTPTYAGQRQADKPPLSPIS